MDWAHLVRRYREIVVVSAFLLGGAVSVGTHGLLERVDGFLYDIATSIASLRQGDPPSNVAVIALDRQSLTSSRFEHTPRVFFGPHYAELIEGLLRGDAKAIGFDTILSFAAGRFEPMQQDYDDSFMSALSDHRDVIVLARTLGTKVAEPYMVAVYDESRDVGQSDPLAIAYAELVPSEDGVQRWIHPSYRTQSGAQLPSFAARLAEIGGARIPDGPFLLAPKAPLESIPTYSFVDVLNCIETSPEIIRSAFANKVVLFGSNLPEEDRKRASDAYLKWPKTASPTYSNGQCVLKPLGYSSSDGSTVPGVHIHAAAVESMIASAGVILEPAWARIATTSAVAAICAVLALYLSPLVAVSAVIVLFTGLFGASVVALTGGRWLPIAVPGIAGVAALIGGQIARFFGEERKRRRIERAFGHYLAPEVVAQLGEAEEDLKLGGEMRNVTVIFADLSGFTATSDTMEPAALMELTNRYFKVIVEAIDNRGGYVDKFIGDSVMAIWGAPASLANPPLNAVASAFEIVACVRALRESAAKDHAGFDVKIGMSSGPAIVGNVGAPRRLSYTALGPTVNLAARLEKVCSTFGCRIVVDAATMTRLRGRYLFCELDAVSLKGKRDLVPVYEAIAPLDAATEEQREYVTRYETALRSYRDGEFEVAAIRWSELAIWSNLGNGVNAARVMADKARALVRTGDVAGAYVEPQNSRT